MYITTCTDIYAESNTTHGMFSVGIFSVLEDAWTWSKFKVVSLILEASEAQEVIVHLAMRKESIRTQHTHIRIAFRFRQRSMPRQVVDRILPFQYVISVPGLLNNLLPSTVHDLVSIANPIRRYA